MANLDHMEKMPNLPDHVLFYLKAKYTINELVKKVHADDTEYRSLQLFGLTLRGHLWSHRNLLFTFQDTICCYTVNSFF